MKSKDFRLGFASLNKHTIDFYDDLISLFDENFFTPMDETDNNNWCLSKGTKIKTVNGDKNIEDIFEGDLVITETGIYPVVNVLKHFSDNNIKLTMTDYNIELIGTTNHKLIVSDGKDRYRKEISELDNSIDNLLLYNGSSSDTKFI